MKKLMILLAISIGLLSGRNVLGAQPSSAETVSVCSLVQNPAAYAGHNVIVRGRVNWKIEDLLMFDNCADKGSVGFLIQFADKTVEPAVDFELTENQDLEAFRDYMRARPKQGAKRPSSRRNGLYIGNNYTYCQIEVTLSGRFDAIEEAQALRGDGFGNAGRQRFRLVVGMVSQPIAEKCKPPTNTLTHESGHADPPKQQ